MKWFPVLEGDFSNKNQCRPATLSKFKNVAHCVFEFDTPGGAKPKHTAVQHKPRDGGSPVGVDSTFFWPQLKAFCVLPQRLLVLAPLHKVVALLLQTAEKDLGSPFWKGWRRDASSISNSRAAGMPDESGAALT